MEVLTSSVPFSRPSTKMNVSTANENVSLQIKTEISLDLNFEVKDLEEHFEKNSMIVFYSEKFSEKLSNGRIISGTLTLFQQAERNGLRYERVQRVDLEIENAKNVRSAFKINFNQFNNDMSYSGALIADIHYPIYPCMKNREKTFYGLRLFSRSSCKYHKQIADPKLHFKGTFSITFETEETNKIIYQEKMSALIMNEVFGKGEQVELEAFDKSDEKYKKIGLNKYLLTSISDVFKTMLEDKSYCESKNHCVRIEDFSFEVLCRFKDLIIGNTKVQERERFKFDVQLLMFANKYNIKLLVKQLTEEIVKDFLNGYFDNLKTNASAVKDLLAITEAAYLMEYEVLFEHSAKGIHKNLALMKNSEEWKLLRENHPYCVLKVMDLMIVNA